MGDAGRKAVIQVGHNCWRREQASRLAVIVDGEHYYRAVREAILAARDTVYIVGWDIHSQLQLVREGGSDGSPEQLGELVDYVAREHGVDVYVLSWDFAMIYWLERESLPLYRLDWKTHDRVHFHMDDSHPLGASQHQKIVVIDDALAFCGGLDLSKWRWDTREHRPGDARRLDPDGEAYQPFHDMQMVVEGEPAAALSDLCRERWTRATGEAPRQSAKEREHTAWPSSVEPLLQDVSVAIARTQPQFDDVDAVHEAEQLYLDAVRSARRWIYIENQYLTSHTVGDALADRLKEDAGPEVVIVLPRETGGWLEQHTMDVLRYRLVKKLQEADRHGRLRIFYPRLSDSADSADSCLMVHAKLIVADDCLLRIGSSNLSNRSMGLDSECDLAIEAESERIRAAISFVRNDLLAEHLGVTVDAVASAIDRHDSLLRAIEELAQGERTLCPLDTTVPPEVDELVPDAALIDPEKPVSPEQFVSQFVPLDKEPGLPWRVFASVLLVMLFAGLAAAWRWTAVGDWLDVETLVAQAQSLKAQPAAPLLATLGIALAGCLAVPLTLLVIASALAFGPLAGFAYSLAGGQISALITYGAGHAAGRDLVRRYAGEKLNRISKALARRGILTVVVLRLVPVAPFVIINAVAGASRISFRDFAVGTLLGMAPGMLGIALFADSLIRTIRQPNADHLLGLLLVVAVIIGAIAGLRYFLRRAGRGKQTD